MKYVLYEPDRESGVTEFPGGFAAWNAWRVHSHHETLAGAMKAAGAAVEWMREPDFGATAFVGSAADDEMDEWVAAGVDNDVPVRQ